MFTTPGYAQIHQSNALALGASGKHVIATGPAICAVDSISFKLLNVFVWCGLVLQSGEKSLSAETFPYLVETIRQYSRVRSGPSTGAYPTSRLKRGAVLEVHHHAPGGWRAIRPPLGSYSWAPLRHLRRKESSPEKSAEGETRRGPASPSRYSAVVLRDGLTPWIGSELITVDAPFWQVRLRAGEHVEVLGRRQLTSPDGGVAQTWCKIAPPAGEFRWIHARYIARVDAQKTTLGVAARLEPNALASAADSPKSANAHGPAVSAVGSDWSDNSKPAVQFQTQPARHAEHESPIIQPSFDREKKNIAAELPEDTASNDAPNWILPAAPMDQATFSRKLATLKKDIARAGASSPGKSPYVSSDQIDALQRRAAELISRGPTPLDRGKARLINDRIAKLAQTPATIRENNPSEIVLAALDAPPPPPKNLTGLPTRLRAAVSAATKPLTPLRYDGAGWLQPVLSTEGAPPFALTDDQGRILQYVIPAPGFNLRRYAKRKVGIYGRRGISQRYNTRVLVAQRVVVLERQ